jgi:hypothetical protein
VGEAPAEIRATPLGHGRFLVEVIEGGSSTIHEVTVAPEVIESLDWKATPEELIRASFRFLLEREPKDSIMHAFDIEVIGNYFPEWEGEARGGFAGA